MIMVNVISLAGNMCAFKSFKRVAGLCADLAFGVDGLVKVEAVFYLVWDGGLY